MATGALSAVCGTIGIGALAGPLLVLAALLAVVIPVRDARDWHRSGVRAAPRGVGAELGRLMVPMGLAVIGSGLAGLGGPVACEAAPVAVVGAWVGTLVVFSDLSGRVIAARPGAAVTGAWFLAPAALLADVVGVVGLVGVVPGSTRAALGVLAAAGCALGTSGYAALLVVVVRRATSGPGPAPRAPWWIAAGCGGLAASAWAKAASAHLLGGDSIAMRTFDWTAFACWAAGSAVLLPVLFGSLRFLAHLRRPGRLAWPPVFSSAVYALGTAQVGRFLSVGAITSVADVAGAATLTLWTVAVLGRLWRTRRRQGRGERRWTPLL